MGSYRDQEFDDRARGVFNTGEVSKERSSKRPLSQFEKLGKLSPPVLKAIHSLGYPTLTPIQKAAIPVIIDGGDACIVSKTGSGKTAAYSIPLVNLLACHRATTGIRGLVIAPTRELCVQIGGVIRKLSRFTDPELRVCLLVGGEALERQFTALTANPDIIVCTPGRILHIHDQISTFKSQLKSVEYVCFDESDRMFEMNFQQQVNEILDLLPAERTGGHITETKSARDFLGYQIIMVSATMPQNLAVFSKARLQNPAIIAAEDDMVLPNELTNQFIYCPTNYRDAALLYICRELVPKTWKLLVFVATKHHCEYLTSILQANNLRATCIYGSLDQRQRTIALSDFDKGRYNILISTDVAARGIDIPSLDCVINYNFPSSGKNYVHRVGRSARAGSYGLCVSIIEGDELPYCLDVMLHIGVKFHSLRPSSDVVTTFLDNCKTLGVDYTTFACLVGKHATQSSFQGLTATIPGPLLDVIYADILRTLGEYGQDIRAQQKTANNAMKQVNSMRKSASPMSTERAKEIISGNMIYEHPLVHKIGIEKAEPAEKEAQEAALEHLSRVLYSFKVPTQQLEMRVTESNGDASSVAMLNMRRIVEKKARERQLVANELQKLSRDDTLSGSGFHDTNSTGLKEPPVKYYMTKDDLERYTILGKDAIEKRRTSIAQTGTSSRDDNLYISDVQPAKPESKGSFIDAQTAVKGIMVGNKDSIENVIADFIPDDKEGLASILRRKAFERRWNPLRKRYENVEIKAGETKTISDAGLIGKKKITQKRFNESTGKWVEVTPDTKQSLYKKWKQKTSLSVMPGGQQDTVTDMEARELLTGQGLGRRRRMAIERAINSGRLVRKAPASKVDTSIERSMPTRAHIIKEREGKKHQEKMRAISRSKKNRKGAGSSSKKRR